MNSPLFFERYELKFLIPGSMMEDIRSFIEPYCRLDPFCEKSPDNFYRINSLYLDSQSGIFYKKRQASVDGRFNIFTKLATIHHVEPKVMTSYRRMAYLSEVDEYARVTFDRNLKCYEPNGFDPLPSLDLESNYDNECLLPPDCDTVLELKSTTNVPLWMVDLIRYFRLERTSFSKYCKSFQHVYKVWNDLANRRPNDVVAIGHR